MSNWDQNCQPLRKSWVSTNVCAHIGKVIWVLSQLCPHSLTEGRNFVVCPVNTDSPELLFFWTIRITRLVLFILSLLHCCCFGDSCCQSYNFLFSFSVSRRFITFCRTSLQLFPTFLSQCCAAALHCAVFLIMDKLWLVKSTFLVGSTGFTSANAFGVRLQYWPQAGSWLLQE